MSQAASQPGSSGAVSGIWGPFRSGPDAAKALCPLIDGACGKSVGIFWAVGDTLYPLRIPVYDGGGFAETVVVEWSPQPSVPAPAPKPHHHGVWGHIRDWVHDYCEMQGEIAQNQAMVAQAETQAIRGAFTALERRTWNEKTKGDTIGVGMDVVAVALTIGFAGGVLATIAVGAGIGLLFIDGAIWATELAGYDEAAENFKKDTVLIRWPLILAALPDAAVGLFKAVKETPELVRTIGELRQQRALTQANALRATAGAGRMDREANTAEGAMNRARYRAISEKYADYAERANARAQKESQNLQIAIRKLSDTLVHEITPRLTVPATIGLMGNDELKEENEDIIARNIRRLKFHIVSSHR